MVSKSSPPTRAAAAGAATVPAGGRAACAAAAAAAAGTVAAAHVEAVGVGGEEEVANPWEGAAGAYVASADARGVLSMDALP